jgi:hypothetical protein
LKSPSKASRIEEIEPDEENDDDAISEVNDVEGEGGGELCDWRRERSVLGR